MDVSNDRYPVLSRWLQGAPAANIWAQMLSGSYPAPEMFLEPLEQIVAIIDSADPGRLASKRVAFRNDTNEANVLALRVELVVAATLIWGELQTDFGGPGEPDLLAGMSSGRPLWFEVTTRARDDLDALHDEAEAALGEMPVMVTINVSERLLKISASDRSTIVERIVAAASHVNAGEHETIVLPELPGMALCTGEVPIGPSRVSIDSGVLLTSHTAEIELELRNVLKLKTAQASKNAWPYRPVLMVDMSRVGLSWLRPEGVWATVLKDLIVDWSGLPFVALMVAFTSLDSTYFGGAWAIRPDATEAERQDLDEAARVLGLRVVTA
jgi:hypothetical protein